MNSPASRQPLMIFGAGGHGRVVADAAVAAGYEVLGFLDDDPHARIGPPWRMLDEASAPTDVAVHVAIGNNEQRRAVTDRRVVRGCAIPAVIHPSAVVSPTARIGDGVFIGPLAVVNAHAVIGKGVIVNTAAVVEHDCRIGAFCHLAPRSVLGGGVHVGAGCLVGIGSAVLPGVAIDDGGVVAAGAVVTTDVPSGTTVRGVPARA